MNKTKTLLLFILFVAFSSIILSHRIAGQGGGGYTTNVSGGSPGQLGCPPAPIERDRLKGVVLGVIRRQTIYQKPPKSKIYVPIPGADEFRDIGGPQDLSGPNNGAKRNIDILDESKTGWVRLWVDWPTVQPSVADMARLRGIELADIKDPNDFRNHVELNQIANDNEFYTRRFIENLDAQIKLARCRGLKIILTSYRYPMWVSFPRNFNNGFPKKPNDESKRDPWNRVPTDLSRDGAWGQWIDFLIERYGDTNARRDPANSEYQRYIDFLEIVNEPNLGMWPQREGDQADGNLFMPGRVARMFKTAQLRVNEHNARLNQGRTTLILVGPATSDTLKNSSIATSYKIFTEALLKELNRDSLNFIRNDKNFAWSHHNYLDIEEQRNCAENDPNCPVTRHCNSYEKGRVISKLNSAAFVRRRLVEGVDGSNWTGWSSTGSSRPSVLLTEGGARLTQVDKIYRCRLDAPKPPTPNKSLDPATQRAYVDKLKNKQAELVRTSYHLMNEGELRRGIELFSNFLTYTDLCYDTGLFDYLEFSIDPANGRDQRCANDTNYEFSGGGGGERPLYTEWKKLPQP